MTDCVTSFLDTLERSILLNEIGSVAHVHRLDWRQVESDVAARSATPSVCSSEAAVRRGAFPLAVPEADVVIFSEVVYNQQSARLIPIVCRECLRRGGHVIAAMPQQGMRHSAAVPPLLALLHESMAAAGFVDAPGAVPFERDALQKYTESGANLDNCVLWVWAGAGIQSSVAACSDGSGGDGGGGSGG